MLLHLENVTRAFALGNGAAPLPVLRGVSLDLDAGQTLAIVGPSGCGKSTLLNIIGTLERPDAGRVELGGRDLSALDDTALAAVRNREIGFIFQQHHLLPQCTVVENVLVPTLAKATSGIRNGQPGPDPESETPPARAERLLKRVGLGERLNHRPGQLSGGERQRVAVVRALINQPKLLLADEPTGALDRASAAELAKLLLELNREEGVALVVVTHALDLAQQMGRVMELKEGVLKRKEDGG
jgi:ABC-type lipoprotein export system ATPase subunit